MCCHSHYSSNVQGRFHHVLHVQSPTGEDAIALFQYFGRKFGLNDNIVHSIVRDYCDGAKELSGAEIEGICREAAMSSIRSLVSDFSSNKH